VPKKKGRQPLTLIVVPHSERAPISFRLPTWLFPFVYLLSLAMLIGVGFFAMNSYRLTQEIRELREDRQLQLAREREMRSTILMQQEEVQGLSRLVQDFQSELTGVSSLSAEVRDLIGLPSPQNTPIAALAAYSVPAYPTSLNSASEERYATIDSDARGGHISSGLSNSSMLMAVEKSQAVIGMQETLPDTLRELVDLRREVLARMEKIEPDKRTNPADLEKQLRLLAAAPHLWPTEYRRISSKFGYRTLYGQLEFHNGVDMPMWYGSKVLATKDGVVTSAGWQGDYGWAIEVEHEMGFTTTYGHNSKLLVQKGDEVKAGDVIALSGSSGRSTGPHLHYEIRLGDVPVDPLKYLDTDVPYTIEK
jgi:murein DD-endopeptidase MepM/ murein hydrolase activator NlpD